MARAIRMTDDEIEETKSAFCKMLDDIRGRVPNGTLSFTRVFKNLDEKATIVYTREAWEKQRALVDTFDKEVAWHGVCDRVEDTEQNIYLISDIVVYPQTVTATTVEMDEEKYAQWLMENDEDERFSRLFMQGHSHVRMATGPSGTDTDHQNKILSMLTDEDFYIFGIWNKAGQRTNKIYDLKKNIMFDDKDIRVTVIGNKEIEEFIKEAKELVVAHTYKTPTYNGGYYGGGTPYDPMRGSTRELQKKDDDDDKPKTQLGKYPLDDDDEYEGGVWQLHLPT